eukprot:CAMPEP_0201107120 /NCGR_PEP_ID=MMETSP0812-20130820/55048_1 /ASSEMBLY_ACC=CAM_ASM_000668 /TAXON_ID=98059 /ORGANISM="Dinobryon sp., Strain UTEXLB2267" /LENGTH=180 /DNA_ID=CAMNT_0047367823 /DNA_START=60 /DNA_END=602 /DNA_ORIENTATION=+
MNTRLLFRQSSLGKISSFQPLGSTLSSSYHNSSTVSSIIRPKDIYIPLDKVEFQFARSSGPGGQNVNKLNTKAELRFNVSSADWIPSEVKQRLRVLQASKISKDGELYLSSQEHRTQTKNKDDCVSKLQEILADAYIEPKERQMWEGLSEKGKDQRKQERKRRGEVKESRRSKNVNDYSD